MPAVIQVKDLGKEYRIGASDSAYSTLRETLANTATSFWKPKREKSKKIWALSDVSFEVGSGEVVGIIGRNGAGKTTLLKILSRITEPTTGRVELRGRVGSLLEVGTGFHPELTGRENIYLNGSILGMRREEIERRFDEIVAFAEVTEFIDTPVKRYSSGMYLRLAFAVAAHLETEILLVDEVLAVGDVQFQKKCMGKIEQVAGQGRTVLFVSHNMPAVQRLCTRGILLSGGTIVHDGNVRPVIQEYLTLDLGQAGERTWPDDESAPGDSVARMRAVRALNLSGEVSSEFSVRDDWYLEVEFAVLSPGYHINVNIFLYDESGILIFAAGDYQLEEWHERNREVGVYRSRCRVPKDLLNDGTIRVLAGIYSPPSTLRGIERDAISVRINEDLSTSGARGFYPGPWPGGAVRPSLDWESEFVPRSNQL
ncbi:MAG TPA: ABC transporter ATP-binding protein [Pyrinomonadaceae bacterium]|jgi:lipopolysaccharide transport system ATP-binding protein|nr:ABC transporter ATP-binding protein [Pyrinomonadaceae bacterium]